MIPGEIPSETKMRVLGENSVWGSLSKAKIREATSIAAPEPSSGRSSPFPQGLEAAHAAQHQLWVILVGVHFLIIGDKGVLPLVQFLIPGSLDLLPSGRGGLL